MYKILYITNIQIPQFECFLTYSFILMPFFFHLYKKFCIIFITTNIVNKVKTYKILPLEILFVSINLDIINF
jgi:hypothetical protein